MKKLLILLGLLVTSCVTYDNDDFAESEYDCGIVVGGERRAKDYYLLVSYPDGEFWEKVTEKAYHEYKLFDEICFGTITW